MVAGIPGPPPKRKEETRRRNKTTESGVSNAVEKVVVSHELLEDPYLVDAPSPNPAWHPLALQAYWAARTSAVREFWEPTDWSALFITLEQLSSWLNPQTVVIQNGAMAGATVEVVQPMPGGVLTAIMKSLGELMFMEGARRKLRMEVERVSGAALIEQAGKPTGDNVIEIRGARLNRPNQGSAS